MSVDQPPPSVLRAFGVEAPARLLAGCRGTAWLVGDLVLKSDGGPVYEWVAAALLDVTAKGVRIAPSVSTIDGAWLCDGWSATRWVEGGGPDRSKASTWIEIIEAGRAFHRAVAEVAKPDFLDMRTDSWALADRAVRGERPIRFRSE